MATLPQEKQFTYRARDTDGDIRTGQGTAADAAQIIRELTKRRWVPLDVREGGGGFTGDIDIQLRTRAKLKSLVITTRQMASCLQAGLPITDALDIMVETDDRILANGVRSVKRDVDNGSSLSAAMRRVPNAFPEMITNMLRAGEEGGFLPDAAEQVADNVEAEYAMKQKIRKAVFYPAVVLGASAAIFIFMMVYIVPTFASLYESMSDGKVQLPLLTRIVVAVSHSMVFVLPILAVLGVAFFFWWRKYGKTEKVREVWDPLRLKIPVFGGLMKSVALTRFNRNLGSLIGAGVTLQESLALTAATVGNLAFERTILAARDAVLRGRPLLEPLRRNELFPKMTIQFINAGEKSGDTDQMLNKAAAIYDREVNEITDNLTALLEPLFIIILAIMVGIIAMAIYLPYLNIGNLMDAG